MSEQDESYLGDLEISMDDAELDKLTEEDKEIDNLIQTAEEAGGINKQLVVDMESLRPNIITSKVPLNSFTEDFSRTNYKVTMEALEDMSDKAKLGIAIGVGVFVASLVGWIISKFFGDDDDSSGGGGGGGGGGSRDKDITKRQAETAATEATLKGIQVDIIQQQKSQEAAYKAMVEKSGWEKLVGQIDASNVTKKGQSVDDGLNAIYETHLRKHYSTFIDELINSPSVHLTLAHHIVSKVPTWTNELAGKQNQLTQGKIEGLKPEDFRMKVTLPGGGSLGDVEAIKMATIYKEKSQPNKDLKFPDFSKIEKANFMEDIIQKMPENQEALLKEMKKELDSFVNSLKGDTELSTKLAPYFTQMRASYVEIGACYQILVKMVDGPDKLLIDLRKAQEQRVAFLERVCNNMASVSEEAEKSTWTKFKDSLKGIFSSKPKK